MKNIWKYYNKSYGHSGARSIKVEYLVKPNATPASPKPSSAQFNPGETSGARQPRLSHQSTFSHSLPFVNSHYSPPIGSLSKPSFPSPFINSLQRREFDYKSQADPLWADITLKMFEPMSNDWTTLIISQKPNLGRDHVARYRCCWQALGKKSAKV